MLTFRSQLWRHLQWFGQSYLGDMSLLTIKQCWLWNALDVPSMYFPISLPVFVFTTPISWENTNRDSMLEQFEKTWCQTLLNGLAVFKRQPIDRQPVVVSVMQWSSAFCLGWSRCILSRLQANWELPFRQLLPSREVDC